MSESLIQLEGVSKVFYTDEVETHALSEIDLSIERGEYVSIASLGDEVAKRTILIDGVSKAYAMTGWRIGWTVGPKELIKGMSKIQGQSTSGANHLAQMAATQALVGPQDCVAEMREQFDARRKRMVELLNDIEGVECQEPHGAFYAFANKNQFLWLS